jgi:hypothetical protein
VCEKPGRFNPVFRVSPTAVCNARRPSLAAVATGERLHLTATGTFTVLLGDAGGSPYAGASVYPAHEQPDGRGCDRIWTDIVAHALGAQANAYTFSGTSGQIAKFTMTRTSGSVNPVMRIYRPGGTLICSFATNGSSTSNDCPLDASGTHTVLASDWGGTPYSGTYDIALAFWQAYAGEYSYDDSSCSIQKDPITMIFRQSGADVAAHVSHHGSTNGNDPTDPALRSLTTTTNASVTVPSASGTVSQVNKDGDDGFRISSIQDGIYGAKSAGH